MYSVLHYRQMSYSLRHLTITTKIRSTVVGGETVPMEEPVEPPFKKQRFSEGKYALLSCFDEPDNFIEVNVSLIDSIGCRLASLIKHTAPSVAPSGKIFWRSDMTRAMLLTFVRSVTVGELVVAEGVTVGEALSVFNYEGVRIGHASEASIIEPPRFGVAYTKRSELVAETLVRLCENVADAIVLWPRLEMILDSAMGFPTKAKKMYHTNITATSNRIWVRFADRPMAVDTALSDADFVVALVHKNPKWFSETMISIGIVHYCMSVHDSTFGKNRDESSLRKLCAEINRDKLGLFFGTNTDACKFHCESKLRKMISKGEKFANEISNTIIQSAQDSIITVHHWYARSVVTFARNVMYDSPVCGRVFSSLCADDDGSTTERIVLKRALKTRGVNVVRWVDQREANVYPLVFPFHWRAGTSSWCGPSVLLSFDELR